MVKISQVRTEKPKLVLSLSTLRANKLRFHCSVLDISLAEEKNAGIHCFRSSL